MATITIPSRLANLIHGLTDEISAAVGSAIAAVQPILSRNEAPFFSDYTDHGIGHVESVLTTCELMIGDDSWAVFTREDAAVLVLAALTHDLGMLITVEAFSHLVDPDNSASPPLDSNDAPWHKLWREFQLDARRFDGQTLIRILGTPEPVAIHELEPTQFTERGMKMVGEFLRLHHHRLAHEIVLFGMPAGKGRVDLFQGVPQYLREIVGIVARSHGVAVRECLDFLMRRDRTGHREYRHIHPTFLMCLIRLADYLDLDIGRAPASVLAAKSLRSPISRREWWSHRSLVDCHSFTDDPECLHVVVEPEALPDVSTFAVVEEKIIGIQQELDACWAVLGEVYGRFPPLNRLSLKIRRIRSDLRALATIQQLPFVPYKAALEAARADLLKLLIEPLYGDHPGIGVRELVQNALDAVRELEYVLEKTPSLSGEREELDGDIVVFFEKDSEGKDWLVIADRGIGMTWSTISKYYLTAGASFRQSDAWRKRFTDDSGTSQILRSGRFGIGVLAAFLLGERVIVSSRHFEESEDRGVQFEFGLDDSTIELRWSKRKVGTTIKVRVSEPVMTKLMESYEWKRDRWDWYCLEKPALVRRDMNGQVLKQEYRIPSAEGPLPVKWHRIRVSGYQSVDWTYQKHTPRLACNGILVPHGNIYISRHFELNEKEFDYYGGFYLQSPHVSIFDPDGRLPLNLARENLAARPTAIETALALDVCRNFLAYCLTKGPEARMLSDNHFSSYATLNYPGRADFGHYLLGFFFDNQAGFGLADPWNISHFTASRCLLMRVIRSGSNIKFSKSMADSAMAAFELTLCVESDGTLTSFDYWHKRLVLHSSPKCLPAFRGLKVRGFRTLMPNKWYKRFIAKQPQYIVNKTHVWANKADNVILTVDDCPKTDDLLLAIGQDFQANNTAFESLTECFFTPVEERPKPNLIAQVWQEAVGQPIIPFETAERKRIAEALGEQFKMHLAEWVNGGSMKRTRKP